MMCIAFDIGCHAVHSLELSQSFPVVSVHHVLANEGACSVDAIGLANVGQNL